MDAQPRELHDVLAQYLAGLKFVQPETREERHAEGRQPGRDRFAVARELYNQVRDGDRANPDKNPFNPRVAKLSADEADAQARETSRYIQDLLHSGRVVDADGKMTEDGKRRLRNATLYLFALHRRSREKPSP